MVINYTPEDLVDHDAVGAIIKDSEGRILMQKHVKFGFWTIPIGKAKPGQSATTGVKEEIFEECNLRVNDLKEIKIKETSYDRNGKEVKVVIHIYEILDYSGELENKEPHKHSEQKFLSVEEIEKFDYLSDSTILFLESLGIVRNARF